MILSLDELSQGKVQILTTKNGNGMWGGPTHLLLSQLVSGDAHQGEIRAHRAVVEKSSHIVSIVSQSCQ